MNKFQIYQNPAIPTPLQDQKHQANDFRKKCLRSFKRCKSADLFQNKFKYILGKEVPERMLASNIIIRKQFMHFFVQEIEAAYKSGDSRHTYHITILDDRWQTGDRNTRVDIPKIKTAIRNAFRLRFDSYLANIEFQAFTNVPLKEHKRLISSHCHAIGWTNRPLSKEEIANLERSFWLESFPQTDGKSVDAVKIQKATNVLSNIERLLCYILKAPNSCKTLYINEEKDKMNLHKSAKAERYVLHMRIAEILSYIPIDCLIFAGGKTTQIRRNALLSLRNWVATNNTAQQYEFDQIRLKEFWQKFRETTGTTSFKEPQIIIS